MECKGKYVNGTGEISMNQSNTDQYRFLKLQKAHSTDPFAMKSNPRLTLCMLQVRMTSMSKFVSSRKGPWADNVKEELP